MRLSEKKTKKSLKGRKEEEGGREACYLILQLSLRIAVLALGMVLEELSHVGHDGLLVWLVHVYV